MEDTLRYAHIKTFLLSLADRVMQARDELNNMDAACGDGDFGTSIYIAFANARKTVEEQRATTVGALMASVGNAILSTAGGASGPLFGTFFIQAGKAVEGEVKIDLAQLAAMLDFSMKKVQACGGAVVGDKTLVDALQPAVESLRAASIRKVSMLSALEEAATAAKTGCESTRHLVARHGRARYLGEQTLGFLDPGAHLMALIFETIWESCKSHLDARS
jgi:dihydroxyacetone kinase-like protein